MMKLKKEYKVNHKDKIKPGNTSFNSNDRLAIKDVIDAYGFYWDSNNLDGYLSLFTDEAMVFVRSDAAQTLLKAVGDLCVLMSVLTGHRGA